MCRTATTAHCRLPTALFTIHHSPFTTAYCLLPTAKSKIYPRPQKPAPYCPSSPRPGRGRDERSVRGRRVVGSRLRQARSSGRSAVVPWVRPSVGGGVLEPQPAADVSQKSRPPARFWPCPEPIRASWTAQRGQNLAGPSSPSKIPGPPPPGASPCRARRPCAPATRAFGSPGTSRIWRSMVITRTTASRGVARATPRPHAPAAFPGKGGSRFSGSET